MALVPAVRDLASRMSQGLVVVDFRTQAAQVAATFASERYLTWVSIAFGALALLLLSIGLYGVLSYSVLRRTREIGLRMALGARRRHVVGGVVGETLRLVGAGIVGGVVLTFMVTRFLQHYLFGVGPTDAIAVGEAVALMLLVAITAAAWPARRAAGIDPMVALRTE